MSYPPGRGLTELIRQLSWSQRRVKPEAVGPFGQPAPEYDGWPLVMLRFERVDVDRLAELVTDRCA